MKNSISRAARLVGTMFMRCSQIANWNAQALAGSVEPGTPAVLQE